MDCKELRALATKLEEGAAADIWYDAHEHRDDDFVAIIEDTQEAMTSAARFLKALAEVLE